MLTNPVKSKRVFKNAADKARQNRMEGKNTPFQIALRGAESSGLKEFEYEGKMYAANSEATPPIVPPVKSPVKSPVVTTPGKLAGTVTPVPTLKPAKSLLQAPNKSNPILSAFNGETTIEDKAKMGSYEKQKIHGGGASGPNDKKTARQRMKKMKRNKRNKIRN
jgi:hypothetical protein